MVGVVYFGIVGGVEVVVGIVGGGVGLIVFGCGGDRFREKGLVFYFGE